MNCELPSTPVNIVERQLRNLICSQSKASKQQQDRVVSASERCMPATGVEHGLNLIGQKIRGKRREPPRSHTGHAARKLDGSVPSVLQKTHEHTNGRTHMCGGSRAAVSYMPLNESHDVRASQADDVLMTRHAMLLQELPSKRDMANGRYTRQSPLVNQISVEVLHYLFELVQRVSWPGRNSIDLPKQTKQSNQCGSIAEEWTSILATNTCLSIAH